MLQREYADIQRRTGQTGVAAADQLAQHLDAEGLLYNPNANDDLIRAEMRATAEQSKAHERGLRTGAFLTELDTEIARRWGPGSSWNDAEREKWEQELRMGTVETVNRAFGDPGDAADRAILGMVEDDQRHATGNTAFERALDAELAEHNSHARQNSPHLKALNEANVKDWEETHDSDGWNRITQDGKGNEYGQRY